MGFAYLLKNIILWVVVFIPLSQSYLLGRSSLSFGPVVNAAVVSSVLAMLVLLWTFSTSKAALFLGRSKGWWLVAIAPALGAFLLSSVGLLGGGDLGAVDPKQLWVFILWVPVVEELVFRLGIGRFLRKRSRDSLGAYGSALIFACMHSSLASYDFSTLSIPLGPLLLALCCEYIFVKTNRICYSMAFHMCCNGTAIIFQVFDPRWLKWLDFLYLTNS